MVKRLLISAGVAVALGLTSAAQERHSLRFEILKNGTSVARPVLTVEDGAAGSLSLEGLDVTFTPTRMAADRLAIAFEATFDGKTIRPRLTLLKDEPGTITVKGPASDTFELRVALAPPAR